MKKNTLKTMCIGAVLIALSTVLSVIPIVQMPLGGKLTFVSMLPIVLFALMFGAKAGFIATFAYSLIQMALSFSAILGYGMTPLAVVATFVVDYILAYSVLGTAGFFSGKGVLKSTLGAALACFLRYVCHIISGAVIFDIWFEKEWVTELFGNSAQGAIDAWWNTPIVYSAVYNGLYMIPEIILTAVVVSILAKSGAMNGIRKIAGIKD